MKFLKVILILSYVSMASVSAAMITPALPQIELAYHLSHGGLEWVVSIFLLGYAIGQLPYGIIADRFGRLWALRLGLIINCVGVLMCMMATHWLNFPLFLIGRMVTALGAASGLCCAIMLISETFPLGQANVVMSFAIVSFTLGIGLSVVVGGYITQYWCWVGCFKLLLIHGFLMLYFTRFLNETMTNPIGVNIRHSCLSLLKAFKNKKLIAFSSSLGFISSFSYGYSAAAPMIAQYDLNLLPSQYGYWNLLNMLGMISSGFLGAYLIKCIGPKRLMMGSLVSCLVILCLFILTNKHHWLSTWLFFGISSTFYLFSGMIFPAASYFAMSSSQDKANASSAMSFINIGFGMLGVIILGYLPFSTMASLIVVLILALVISCVQVTPFLLKSSQ